MIALYVCGLLCSSSAVSPPAPLPAMMLRKNIRSLTATELEGLREAVKAMKALPASDPCSWEFQANIHNNQCNHSVTYWLPWHRMYLYFFEKILVGHSGGKLKGLPYWDYARSTQVGFPASYYPSTYGASIPNPLYHSPRTNVTSSSFALNFASTDPAPANTNLSFNGFSGTLQSTPHNYVHGAIGGTMGNFLSPLDPIFWPHHCVIDRLWQKWLALGGGRANPTFDSTWMNTSFTFYDYPSCAPVTLKVKDVLDPETQLNYRYVEPIRILRPWQWWKWIELVRPIKFPIPPRPYDFFYDPVRIPLRAPTADIKALGAAVRRTKNQINVVLNFHVTEGSSTVVPFDVFVANAGGQPMKLTTMSVFGVRHEQMEGHSHGEMGMFQLTLSPRASRLLLAALDRGNAGLSFRPQKTSRRESEAQPLTMVLESMSVMQSVRVDKNGRRIGA